MGTRGRGVLVAAAAAAAVVAVIVALPGGDDRASGASQSPGVAPRGLAADNDPAVTDLSGTPTAVTIPALPGPSSVADSSGGVGTEAPAPLLTSTAPPTAGATTSATRSHRTTSSRSSRSRSSTSHAPTTTAPPTTTSRPAPPPATSTRTATHTAAPSTAPTSAPRTTAPRTTAPRTTTSAPPRTTSAPPTTTRTTSKAPPAPHFGIPVTVGNATQIITVTASSSSATTGTLRAWQRRSDGTWYLAHGPYPAWLGAAGIGHQSEGSTRTPLGTFTLTQAFGRDPDPGTALPYHRTNPDDWWVSDVNSKLYNTLQNCVESKCPFNTSVSEHLYYEVPYYDYAVVMDVNRWPAIPGDGSAFFLHVSPHHQPTAGCVAIDEDHLLTIMRWLSPARHPRIATGID